MATEQYFQEALSQNDFIKQDEPSLDKWKSASEVVDESETNLSNGFDCNICLETVQDPIVTLCGHLYCWPCIYKWIHYQSTSSEFSEKQQPQCPVCKTEVSQQTLVPLYGRGQTAKPNSEGKAPHLGMVIPRRPSSPRCGVHTSTYSGPTSNPRSVQQLHYRGYQQQQPQRLPMPGLGGMTMTNVVSPTTGMLGEMVYARIFGNSQTTLYAYPNSYNLAGMSTHRARRQAMLADRSLSRICFFFLCCIVLCLILF